MSGIVVVMLRRTIGSRIPERMRPWACAIVVAVIVGGMVVVSRLWYLHAEASAALDRPILAISVVLGVFAVSGLSILFAEAARDKSGRVEAVLSTLPLSRRAISAIAWSPTIALVCACLAVALPPACSVLVGLGYPAGEAFALVVAALSVGLLVGVGALCASYLLLRSSRWNAARYPIAIVVWITAAAVLAADSFVLLASPGTPAALLQLLPVLVSDAAAGAAIDVPVGCACAVCALAACAAFVVVIARSIDQGHARTVWLTWRGTSWVGRAVADFLYAFRDATSLANIVGAFLANTVLVIIAWQLPREVMAQALPAVEVVIAVFVSSPIRALRGIFASRHPPQQLIGLPLGSWLASQAIVTLTIAAILAAPGLALLALPGSAPGPTLAGLVGSSAIAVVVAVLCGWTVPVSSDNALGQIVMSILCSVLVIVATTTAQPFAFTLAVPLELGILAVFLFGAFVLARAVEGRRWGVPMRGWAVPMREVPMKESEVDR